MSGDEVATKDVPMASSRILTKHASSQPFDNSFHYQSAIRKLNYIEKGLRGDIAHATQQCARYSSNPKAEHGKAVRWLVRYLKGIRLKAPYSHPMNHVDLRYSLTHHFSRTGIQKTHGKIQIPHDQGMVTQYCTPVAQ
jgi:hypothetical protein